MTHRGTRLLAALEAHRAAVTERFDALPPHLVHQSPGGRAWSLAQLGDHFLRVDAELALDGAPASALARSTSRGRSRALQGVLSLPVRIPAPPSARGVMPSAAPSWPDVREQWAALRARWRSASPAAGRVAYRHPLAGPFLVDDALAFLLAHHRHHDAQIRRTLAALGAE